MCIRDRAFIYLVKSEILDLRPRHIVMPAAAEPLGDTLYIYLSARAGRKPDNAVALGERECRFDALDLSLIHICCHDYNAVV